MHLFSPLPVTEKPEVVEPGEGQELCRVCRDIANGIHFGVMTCEGCKKFFRRALKEADLYACKFLKRCSLNPRNRNSCRYCRYHRCLNVGMSREGNIYLFIYLFISFLFIYLFHFYLFISFLFIYFIYFIFIYLFMILIIDMSSSDDNSTSGKNDYRQW